MFITDASAKRIREAALRASEKRHREIVETANEGICIVDSENRIVFANRRLGIMAGCPIDELIGRSASELVPAEDLEEAQQAFNRRDTGRGGQTDQRLKRADGTAIWTSVSHATRVSMILERRDDALLLVVEDDGIGLRPSAPTSSTVAGVGLSGMRERTALLGGTLSIESSPGHGTTIYARIPLAASQVQEQVEQTAAAPR